MRKAVSLLMVGLVFVAGCARTGQDGQAPAPVAAPAVADQAPAPAAPEPDKPGPLPPPAVKPDARQLFPAYTFVGGARKWGYIDPAGKFVIPPAFDQAAEFESDGLAIVRQGYKSGLINKNGEQVVPPIYDRIEPANADLVRVVFTGDAGQAVDTAGKLLFGEPHLSDTFGSGLAAFRDANQLYGYVNRKGEVVIPAAFHTAFAFRDRRAVVQTGAGAWAVIDTTGTRLGVFDADWAFQASENLIAFENKGSFRWGYAAVDGQVVVPGALELAGPFIDGLAAVSTEPSAWSGHRGAINAHGEFVIPAQYGALEPLGAGLCAAAKPTELQTPKEFLPTAILNREGKQLTDFQYYNVQPVAHGLISVSDGTTTFFLDTQGKPAPGLPTVGGFGTLRLDGDLVRADVDGRVSYLRRDGLVVWQSNNTIKLAGGLQVAELVHRPNPPTLIVFPEFAGMADPQAQEALNRNLRAAFTGGSPGSPFATTNVGFSVSQLKNLVIIYENGYWYGWGAAHGMPSRSYYHVDAQTGKIYTLADLFKKDSQFTDRLRDIIRQQITTRQDKPMQENPEVKPNQAFYVSADALTIYYRPYEIASYAQGFIEFPIPWSEISDLIDTDSPFWESFH